MNACRRTLFLLTTTTTLLYAHAAPAVEPDYSKDPVLMVHGYFLGEGPSWAWMKSALKDHGWPEEYLFSLQFNDVFGCNPEHGYELDVKIEEVLAVTGRARLDILAHSMGAVDVRWHIKNLCGYLYIKDFVCLAGANQGSMVGCIEPFSCGAEAMCVGPGDNAWMKNPFLMELNFCDMTPGDDILYTSIWTPYDEIIVPPENCILDGALNIKLESYVEHGLILTSPEALPHVMAGLDGGGLNNNLPKSAPPCVTLCEEPPPDPQPEAYPEASPEPTPDVVEPAVFEVVESPEPDLADTGVHPPDLPTQDKTGPAVPDLPGESPSNDSLPPTDSTPSSVTSTIPAARDSGCNASSSPTPLPLALALALALCRGVLRTVTLLRQGFEGQAVRERAVYPAHEHSEGAHPHQTPSPMNLYGLSNHGQDYGAHPPCAKGACRGALHCRV